MGSLQLDEDSFYKSCQHLLQRSEQLRDGWSWEQLQGTKEGYLRKTALCSVAVGSKDDLPYFRDEESSALGDADHTNSDLDCEEDTDVLINCPATQIAEDCGHVFQFEYHVTYSSSYRTPVLYFRAFSLEGQGLSLEEVWRLIRSKLRLPSQDSLLSTITQQEHPLLGQPFFMLHPCKTEDFMRPVLQAAHQANRPVNYVLTWLSVVGPLVGLDVPLEYSLQPNPVDLHSEPG